IERTGGRLVSHGRVRREIRERTNRRIFADRRISGDGVVDARVLPDSGVDEATTGSFYDGSQ
ncbi:MAG: hypothetical protein ACKOEH_01775, partial [Actinomycetota bacterium]